MKYGRILALIGLLLPLTAQGEIMVLSESSGQTENTLYLNASIDIAILSSPNVVGRYSRSAYDVSLATLMGCLNGHYSIRSYTMADESADELARALDAIRTDGMDAIIAPLTAAGVGNLLSLAPTLPVYIPTVHRRDFPAAPQSIMFGGIDYTRQIKALLPYMSDSVAVFYDSSSVGTQLKTLTEELFLEKGHGDKSIAAYPVDPRGDTIVTHLSRPSSFARKSVIPHLPVAKSAMLSSHMTFSGIKPRNILSTQINVDPAFLSLTQYPDRQNMIAANSLNEFPPAIYESNALMGNDIAFDWVHYSLSVGVDYLVSMLASVPRHYTMRIVDSQVIYPVELLKAQEFGFEPLSSEKHNR